MRHKRGWLCAAAATHLLILASGIFPRIDFPRLRPTRDAYQTITGAGGSFGFFSPDVGNQILVEFKTGDGRTIRLHELVTPEVALRIGNMYRLFVQAYGNEKLKRSVAASLTAQIFKRFEDVNEATMIASVYRFPSLVEYREGKRPETKEVYRITFRLGDKEGRK